MVKLDSNILLVVFVVVAIIVIIYYLNKNDDQPIPNDGTINKNYPNNKLTENIPRIQNQNNSPLFNNNDLSDNIVDDLVSQYGIGNEPTYNNNDNDNECFSASDPMAETYGTFNGCRKKHRSKMESPDYKDDQTDLLYKKKKQQSKMESPSNNGNDQTEFLYKKKKFSKRTPDDVTDLFDVNKMLPQEIEQDWFDTEPLQCTKKIKGTHLIHPKIHMGVNTVGSSLKYGTHDIRGDIPIPKVGKFPWNNSTIEPDTNIRGICDSF